MDAPATPARVGQDIALPRIYLPRTRLWRELDRSTAETALTMLVGPSGSGKTLVVRGWLAQSGSRSDALWLEADPSWRAERLQALVASRPGSLIVIDDAERMPTGGVRWIEDRLNREPASLRLLLISRRDLSIDSLAAESLGNYVCLRGSLLRLNSTDSRTLIAAHAGTQDERVIAPIAEAAGGWIAAAVLAARTVAAAADPIAAAEEYRNGTGTLADQVAGKAWTALDRPVRQLLLCIGSEEYIDAETARRLSGDQDAEKLLDLLVENGLLLTRVDRPPANVPVERDFPSYRLHPLLREVIRRRLRSDDQETRAARATVLETLRRDLRVGRLEQVLERLMAIDEPKVAAEVIGRHGTDLLLRGLGSSIPIFARRHTDVLLEVPTSSFPLALERWSVGDINGALHWIRQLLKYEADPAVDPIQICCVRIMLGLLGLTSLEDSVRYATELLRDIRAPGRVGDAGDGKLEPWGDPGLDSQAARPAALTLLGTAQNWLGQLDGARESLSAATWLGRRQGLPWIAAAALGHLAFTELMDGNEPACEELSAQALDLLDSLGPDIPAQLSSPAALAGRLARSTDVRWTGGGQLEPESVIHPAHFCTRFWHRIMQSRTAIHFGALPEGIRMLNAPLDLPVGRLPRHLQVALLCEQGFAAALASDDDRLGQIERDLHAQGAIGEAALFGGIRADLSGDRRRAISSFEVTIHDRQPVLGSRRPIALVCLAQLIHARGDRDTAYALIRTAAAESAARRNALAFVGWSRHGTPIRALLQEVFQDASVDDWHRSWLQEIAAALDSGNDLPIPLATRPTRAETNTSNTGVSLSNRERDVLNLLARGATYADISAELFLSRNTIKTHVSNLYGKLGASRRSEALAIARSLYLI